MPIKRLRQGGSSLRVEDAPVTPSTPTPTELEVGPPGQGGTLLEFSESRRPAPRAATVRRTEVPAPVGAAKALTAMRRQNALRAPRRHRKARAANRKRPARRGVVRKRAGVRRQAVPATRRGRRTGATPIRRKAAVGGRSATRRTKATPRRRVR